MSKLGLVALAFALSANGTVFAQIEGKYEIPPVFSAKELLAPGQMQGNRHRIRDTAPSDGYMTHFTIDSDFGTFDCAGERQVAKRIAEIDAIARLAAVSRSDLFAEGVRRSVEAPVDAVKNIVDDPGESVRKLPGTVGHLFKKVGSSVGNTAKKVGRKMDGREEGQGVSGEDWAAAGRGVGNAAKSVAGYDKAKLDTARQLGVDPYSDNVRLQEEMDKVTWAFFAGGLPLRMGAAVASGGASFALTATKTLGLPEDIYDVTPGELALRDRVAMEEMGASAEVVDGVLLNEALSVSRRHSILTTLAGLPGGAGRTEVVGSLATLDKRGHAEFFGDALEQLAERHKLSPYAEVKMLGRLPGGMTGDGYIEVAAPVDYVSWTAEVARFARRDDLTGARKQLIISGKMSPAALAGFGAANWQVVFTK